MAASSNHTGNGAVPASNGQAPLYDEALLEAGARSSSLREWIGLLWSGKWIILGKKEQLDDLATKLDPYVEAKKIPCIKYDRNPSANLGVNECVFMVQLNDLSITK